MSPTWSALHAQLVRSVNRHSALIHFAKVFPAENPPTAFRDPAHLLGRLHARAGNPDAKNDVLAVLLRAAVDTDSDGALATELLLLALWPGLCVVRRRLRPLCRTGTLDDDLLGRFSINIRSARAERINRVAATLLRNLQRDLTRIYIGDNKWAWLATDLEMIGGKAITHEPEPAETILSAAQAALGEDGLLLGAVHLAGFTQREAAEHLGISHDAARKRCQRAMKRLNDGFDA